MTAQSPRTQPQSPDTLVAFLKLLLIGMLKRLPLKLLLAGAIALLAWILHTYLLVVTNEGFNAGNNFWLDRILALQGRTITGTLVWTLGAGLVTSAIARILAYGFGNTIRSVVGTPKYLWQWANELGVIAIPFLLAGYFLTIIFGFFVNNALLIVQLLLFVIGILIARHTSILLTVLRLGFKDAQKLLKRERLIPFNLAWPGMYFVGVLVGLLAIIPSGRFLPFICGCLGFLLVVLISVGLFIRGQGGTKGVIGKKVLIWILPPALLLLFAAVSPVFADDGGWQESGGTFSGWISSPGAARAVAMGFLPAAGSGLGVLLGTALGSMVSILGAAGISGSPVSVRPSSTTKPSPEATPPPPSRTADHQVEQFQQHEQFGSEPSRTGSGPMEKPSTKPPESRTADHQTEPLQPQAKGEPGELSPRHKPEETADTSTSLRSERDAATPSRTGEGAVEHGTGQRDVRGVEPTTPSDAGPGSGSAAESADRVAGMDQDTHAAQMSERHRPDMPKTEGPLADRHQPEGLEDTGTEPARIERSDLKAERHRPDEPTSTGPTAERHDPGGMDETPKAKPAELEQPGLEADRHTPEGQEGPSALRHDDPNATAVDSGRAMRARRAETDEAGPLHSRQPGTLEPEVPIPPVPIPGYALDWELVVVRTPEDSGVTVQQQVRIEGHTRIGRLGEVDLKLLDPKVSRQHADIDIEGSTCTITDLNSSNGTFVNGRRIVEPTELKHGDAIKIGDTYFVVEQRAE